MAQSLAKGLRILFLFTRDRQAMTARDIAAGIGAPLPTAYRFVKVLTQLGLLERHAHGQYQLGLRLLELEGLIHQRLSIENVARPLIAKLAGVSGETAQLTLRKGDRGVCTLVEESPSTLRVAPETGRTLPLHAGASVQAILAFLPEPERRRIIDGALERFTRNTVTEAHKLRRRLLAIRKQGYAVSRGEVYPGAMGIAAPVFEAGGSVVASLAVSGPAQRMAEKRGLIAESVTALATEMSRTMGWRRSDGRARTDGGQGGKE